MKTTYRSGLSTEMLLDRAVLIYENQHKDKILATVHPVIDTEGVAYLGAGQLISRESAIDVLRKLDGLPSMRAFLDPDVLCWESNVLAWWQPSVRRPIYFKTGDHQFDQRITGKIVLHPPLLFRCTMVGLQVWALSQNKRPSRDDLVCQAPYFNLSCPGGRMCTGNVTLPNQIHPDRRTEWSEAFFCSNFTHTNAHNTVFCLHPDKHDGFWTEMLQKNDPADAIRYLTPLSITVEKAITDEH